jgi:8-amino-7-oxononanoate synthase
MLDFTSTLYLGIRHDPWSLRPWSQMTMGVPAALGQAPEADQIAARLAWLQGCEAATLATSTLHLFWDWFGMLPGANVAIYVDAGAYAIARWGVERAACRGVAVQRFPHGQPATLRRLLEEGRPGSTPVVVADGVCTVCGCNLPIGAYLRAAHDAEGLLVVDDTQALGILGAAPDPEMPYGQGGGGSLPYVGARSPRAVVVSSLAKAFGAPIAALSGSTEEVSRFEARSQTRVYCSPPSAASLHAAEHSLNVNTEAGESLRQRLLGRVEQFRAGLKEIGLDAYGGPFPIQTLKLQAATDAESLHRRLLELGVRTVLRRDSDGAARISFILSARHTPGDIEQGVRALSLATTNQAPRPPGG